MYTKTYIFIYILVLWRLPVGGTCGGCTVSQSNSPKIHNSVLNMMSCSSRRSGLDRLLSLNDTWTWCSHFASLNHLAVLSRTYCLIPNACIRVLTLNGVWVINPLLQNVHILFNTFLFRRCWVYTVAPIFVSWKTCSHGLYFNLEYTPSVAYLII